ncbi:hypothetical protein HID58_062817 [Brassica napus]|uniref:Uncharacterized protein n=1 Tax=Brassica napus TaxID=3708 RepID=A0ABQ8A2K7_BRANA|nr:hypothetical protein HID58_062817 [Brassica napus]
MDSKFWFGVSQKKTLLMALSNWSDEKSMEQDSEEELSKVEYIWLAKYYHLMSRLSFSHMDLHVLIAVHTKPVHINHVHTDVFHTFHVDNHIASASSQPFSIVYDSSAHPVNLQDSPYSHGSGGGHRGEMAVDTIAEAVVVMEEAVETCGSLVALLVNVCVDIVDVVGRVVDEDLVVSGCVDVTRRVADGALGGGYESGNRGRGDTGGAMVARLVNSVDGDLMVVCVDVVDVVGRVVDEDFMVSGAVDVVDVTGRVADGALGDGYENGKRDGRDSGSSDSNGGEVEEIVEEVAMADMKMMMEVVIEGGIVIMKVEERDISSVQRRN